MKRWYLWALLAGALILSAGGVAYHMITKRMNGPRWDNLDPVTREMALEVLRRAEDAGLKVMFWDGWRDPVEQQAQIDSGASSVSDPLAGYHTWGLAVDIVPVNAAGLPEWPDASDPRWLRLGEIGEAVGFKWGGRWKSFFDGAHFQRRDYSTASLRATYEDDPLSFLREQGVDV